MMKLSNFHIQEFLKINCIEDFFQLDKNKYKINYTISDDNEIIFDLIMKNDKFVFINYIPEEICEYINNFLYPPLELKAVFKLNHWYYAQCNYNYLDLLFNYKNLKLKKLKEFDIYIPIKMALIDLIADINYLILI